MLLVFISWCCCSCLKDSLPPATSSGEGTMGFKVDGVKWVASSNDFKKSRTMAYKYLAYKYSQSEALEITGISPNSDMSFRIQFPKEGSYQFTRGDTVLYYVSATSTSNHINYSLDLNDPSNELIITHYDRKIISATFSFKLKTPTGEKVSITSGRFDVTISF